LVAELTDDAYHHGFLGLDELPIEERDQHISLAGVQRVLPELEDRTANVGMLCMLRTKSDIFAIAAPVWRCSAGRSHTVLFRRRRSMSKYPSSSTHIGR
jgi:hypothetical protein